jgi:membrane protease YdiL (CAAX protease family)
MHHRSGSLGATRMNRKAWKAAIFVVLTLFASWLLAAVFYAVGGRLNTLPGFVVLSTYMFIPMSMAIIVQKVIYREPLKEPLGISFRPNRWFLVAWLLPPVVSLVTIGASLLFPGVQYSPDMAGLLERFAASLTPEQLEQAQRQLEILPIHVFWISLLQGLIAGITINAVFGFGEELGWRGLLQLEFAPLGFWKSSVLIGLIWGIWHAPIIIQGYNYPQHPVAGVFMMTVWTILLSPIFSYVRLKARSVIAAAIIHGSLNATAGLSLMVIEGGSDLTVGLTGLAGFIVLLFVNLAIFVFDQFVTKEPVTMGKQAATTA